MGYKVSDTHTLPVNESMKLSAPTVTTVPGSKRSGPVNDPLQGRAPLPSEMLSVPVEHISVSEAARILNISEGRVRELYDRGRIPGMQFGTQRIRIMLSKNAVLRLANSLR